MDIQRITKEKWTEIYACRFDMFETHIDNLKKQIDSIKNDKSVSKELIKILKDELCQAQKVLDGFNEVE